jgi:glyoxylase-like metal-dependent hydrolase (beta-lactamase superfamily II)
MKLFFLSSGYATVPKGLFVRGEHWKKVRFPILSILIERKGDLVLFDTGLGERINEEMRPLKYRHNWLFNKLIMKIDFDPDVDPVVKQIKALGYDTMSVKHVIISHLHWDHAGGMLDFPHAEFIVSRKEFETATAEKSHKRAYIREQFGRDGVLTIKQITTIPGKGFLTFLDSFDVFGDGSFVLVDLPGHTEGLMGLILTMPSGRRFLFGGDSFYFPENLEKLAPKSRLMKTLVHEKDEADRTIAALYKLAAMEPSIEMVCSHDHRIPGRYNLAPYYYE